MTYRHTILPAHGGYKKLASYQNAEIIYDLTLVFCKKYKSFMTYKTYEQMIGAARSGKQNIAEGSVISGTSKKSELKLIGVARGSLVELLEDYADFLREYNIQRWHKDSFQARQVRSLVYTKEKSHLTYIPYIQKSISEGANAMICLISQTTYLLSNQLQALEKNFLREGGFTERLYHARSKKV